MLLEIYYFSRGLRPNIARILPDLCISDILPHQLLFL